MWPGEVRYGSLVAGLQRVLPLGSRNPVQIRGRAVPYDSGEEWHGKPMHGKAGFGQVRQAGDWCGLVWYGKVLAPTEKT